MLWHRFYWKPLSLFSSYKVPRKVVFATISSTHYFIYLFMLASMCLICVVFSVIVGDSSRHCDTGLINLTTSYSVIINRFCQRTNTRDLRDLQRSAVALLSQLWSPTPPSWESRSWQQAAGFRKEAAVWFFWRKHIENSNLLHHTMTLLHKNRLYQPSIC